MGFVLPAIIGKKGTPPAPPVSVGTPVVIGSNSSASTPATLAITTTVAVAANETIAILKYANTAGPLITSITDSVGNTYAAKRTGSFNYEVWQATTNIPLGIGGTITVNISGTVLRHGIMAIKIPNLPAYDTTGDATVNGTASVAATNINCGPRTNAFGIVFGCQVSAANPGTFTPGGSWISLFDGTLTGTGGVFFDVAYQLVGNTNAIAYSPTWVNSITYRTFTCAWDH